MVVSNTLLVDTNILLRFLTRDHEEHSPLEAEIIRRASAGEIVLEVPASVVSETVFTLSKVYKLPKGDISSKLLTLFTCSCIKLIAPEWTLSAIQEFGSTSISFGDACVATVARERGFSVLTFDEGYQKIGSSRNGVGRIMKAAG